jgi:hypothetical protein
VPAWLAGPACSLATAEHAGGIGLYAWLAGVGLACCLIVLNILWRTADNLRAWLFAE